ncbi:Pectinesterase inhibitor domain [Macleaya cordata]|uniref:Pectinesterase inhibitor domain n=1 Tax=Macleaya cordata TaxID=56857 RepID=A0A200PPT0_MACCD|nr:Pectinesterase inhibitor domain [Macleaya cordata]
MKILRLLLVVLFILATFTTSTQGESTSEDGDEYVRDACSVTRYQDICIHSLESYSNSAKRSSRKWAQAAVAVAMGEAKNVTHYLYKLKQNGSIRRRRQRTALSDCIECFEETIDNIGNSLGELRRLNAKRFDAQMGNVETWMSSALTYEDTCMDGFEGSNRKGKQVKLLRNKIWKMSCITSNALALVSKLASAGERSLTNNSTIDELQV